MVHPTSRDVIDAHNPHRKSLEFRMNEFFEFFESDQEWMSLEDYRLERDLLLDQSQLIKEGQAITRYLRTQGVPGPQKLPHDRFGSVNGYRRCTLDRWYGEFVPRYEPRQFTNNARLPAFFRRSRFRSWNASKKRRSRDSTDAETAWTRTL